MGHLQNMEKERVLDNFTRGKIYGYILGNPGTYYARIKEALDLNNGTIIYHLKMLEKSGYVYSYGDNRLKRYTPDRNNMPTGNPQSKKLWTRIKKAINTKPGISQKEIAKKIGITTRKAHYHLMRMEKAGIVTCESAGRKRAYTLP